MPRPYTLRVSRIVGAYVGLALLWIVASDSIAETITRRPELQTYKGAAFVLATGALLFVVLSRAASSIRRFESDLLATRERFRSVVENAPEGICVFSGGRFRYVNPAFVRLLGAETEAQLLDQPVLDRIHPDDHGLFRERVETLCDRNETIAMAERRYVRLDGSIVDVDVSAAPFDDHRVKGAVAFLRDIGERKRAQQQKEHLEAQIRQAQKMESIGRLAGGVAHDFNNLLTVINGYSDMLLAQWPEHHPDWMTVQEIRDAGERAAGLTRQLLAFSRQDLGQPAVIEINQVVRETERMLRRLVGEHIRLATDLDPDAGAVLVDPSSLHQVLMNLVVNSRDAMPEGGTIAITTRRVDWSESNCREESEARPGRFVRLTVTDTGAGIDPEIQPRIFEPFFTTKGGSQGTGLGLSTVYGIVRSAGGWISVSSRPGEGTSIMAYLPVENLPSPPNLAAVAESVPRGTETILLVEDETAVRQTTETMLRSFGYRVIAAASAEEAIELAQLHGDVIRLVISDVIMPEMNGPHLIEQLRREQPGLAALLVSGYRPDEMAASAPDGAPLPYLAKPFSRVALAQRVRAVLDQAC